MKRTTIGTLETALADRSGLTKDQVRSVLRAQAAVAYDQMAKGYKVPIPGLGVIDRFEKPGRDMVVQAGPDRGKIIHLPGMQKLRFAFTTPAVNVILHRNDPPPDVLDLDPYDGTGRS